MADAADGDVRIFGLGGAGDRFYAVYEGGDANPSVDEAEVWNDDFGLRAGDLGGEVTDAPVDVGPAVLGVEDVAGGGHGFDSAQPPGVSTRIRILIMTVDGGGGFGQGELPLF